MRISENCVVPIIIKYQISRTLFFYPLLSRGRPPSRRHAILLVEKLLQLRKERFLRASIIQDFIPLPRHDAVVVVKRLLVVGAMLSSVDEQPCLLRVVDEGVEVTALHVRPGVELLTHADEE